MALRSRNGADSELKNNQSLVCKHLIHSKGLGCTFGRHLRMKTAYEARIPPAHGITI